MKVALKLKKKMALIDFEDHEWQSKLWDLNGIHVVKVFYGECNKDFEGTSGDHLKNTIYNLFANFKKSHIQSTLHIRSWCRRKEVLFLDHLQFLATKGKPMVLTTTDHKNVVVEGLDIFKAVNDLV
jgi:hypothetical protein